MSGEHCVEVTVDGEGVRMTFDRPPTDEDLELVASIVRAARREVTITPEQSERQRVMRERIHERNERIRRENP